MDILEESETGSAVIGKNWQVQCTMLAVSMVSSQRVQLGKWPANWMVAGLPAALAVVEHH